MKGATATLTTELDGARRLEARVAPTKACRCVALAASIDLGPLEQVQPVRWLHTGVAS